MEFHSIALFFHIIGGLGIFIALGLEWTGLRQIRSATLPEPVSAFVGILKSAHRLLYVSMLISASTGILSMLLEDGLEAWITVTLGSFILMIGLVKALTGSRVVVLEGALATEKGMLSHTFHSLASHRFLWISIQTRAAIALGILFLMTVKPDFSGSLLTIGIAILLGVVSALLLTSPERAIAG